MLGVGWALGLRPELSRARGLGEPTGLGVGNGMGGWGELEAGMEMRLGLETEMRKEETGRWGGGAIRGEAGEVLGGAGT